MIVASTSAFVGSALLLAGGSVLALRSRVPVAAPRGPVDRWLLQRTDEAERINEEVERLTAAGYKALGVPADVTDASQVGAMVARTVEHFGRLDYAVNNAGVINERQPKARGEEGAQHRGGGRRP